MDILYENRADGPKMAYYKQCYKHSPRLTAGLPPNIKEKHISLYLEQGSGDSIQLLRYIQYLKAKQLTIHCDKALHRLIKSQWHVQTISKDTDIIPQHDYHILSMDLPNIIRKIRSSPYLMASPIPEITALPGSKIGICWEGNPGYKKNLERSCSLDVFKKLFKDNNVFCLQKEKHLIDLFNPSYKLNYVELNDYLDTARLIASLDYVVSVDTSVLHLASALGKKTYGILFKGNDPRWGTKENKSVWYPTLTLVRHHTKKKTFSL